MNLGGGIGGLLNLAQNGQNYSYLYDGKGNVGAVLDPAQSVVAAYRYDPFGKLLAQTGSLTQPFGFSTKRYNPQVGMLHYQYRNYLPEIGRWSTRDPLGEAGGLNLYAFVENDPINLLDPWGYAPKDKLYNLPKKFWNWYHKDPFMGKKSGDLDLSEEEVRELHKEWERLGKPGPDKKKPKRGRGGRRGGRIYGPAIIVINPCLFEPWRPWCPANPYNTCPIGIPTGT